MLSKQEISEIIARFNQGVGKTISVLHEIQKRCGYLPIDSINIVAKEIRIDVDSLFNVIEHYSEFRLLPLGKNPLSICNGLSCHLRGSGRIVSAFEAQLEITCGQSTWDNEFTLSTSHCKGLCSHGPVVSSEGDYFFFTKEDQTQEIIEHVRTGRSATNRLGKSKAFRIEVSCTRCHRSLMDPDYIIDGSASIKVIGVSHHTQGWIRLSSIYSSHNIESQFPIESTMIMTFFCPHCDAELTGSTICWECHAPMVALAVRGGAIMHFCSRRGCKEHLLDLHEMNTQE